MQFRTSTALALFAISSSGLFAQERVDYDVVTRIRDEGLRRSKVMDTTWHLTDLYGPRLTNSPMDRKGAEWARQRMIEFGLENTAIEPWGEFGMGWSFERCVVEMTEPTYVPLIAIPKAWTPGTDGVVAGQPVLINVEKVEDLDEYRGKLAGKIVLNGKVRDIEAPFEDQAVRHDEESLADLSEADLPGKNTEGNSRWANWREQRRLRTQLRELFKEEGVAVLVEPDSGRYNDYGVIALGGGGSRDPEEEQSLPQVVVSAEHFNRMARLIERDQPVSMRVEIAATFHSDDLQGYNVVGEIPGTDPVLRDEIVMMGAHFDTWHPATGATDNGSSCAVVMEAARILKAIGANNRRTIRIALWTGEEQGLLGSRGYVKNHFADRDDMILKPEHSRLSAYFNLDNGSGRIRGVYCQQNAAVMPIFEAWLKPFHDMGATTLTMSNTGGTDHQSFDGVGLPGFQFIQDAMDYNTRTHHTNMDTYERVYPGDVQQAAVVMASFAYHAATRDSKLPRKPLPEARERRESRPEPQPTPAPVEAAATAAAVEPSPKKAAAQETVQTGTSGDTER